MKIADGLVKLRTKAGTNWKGSSVEAKKEDIFSPPQNRNKNNVKMKKETAMRILTGFNLNRLYRV